jgi:hypothetical protein
MNSILYVGTLSHLSCEVRPIFTTVAIVGGVILLVGLIRLAVALKHRGLPEAREDRLLLKWSSVTVVGLALLFSVVPMLAASLTVVYLAGDEVVATGCKRGIAYEVREPLIQMDSELFHSRGGAVALIYSKDGQIRFRAQLEGNRYLTNLATVAPAALRDYADELRSNGSPVPEALLQLSSQ